MTFREQILQEQAGSELAKLKLSSEKCNFSKNRVLKILDDFFILGAIFSPKDIKANTFFLHF